MVMPFFDSKEDAEQHISWLSSEINQLNQQLEGDSLSSSEQESIQEKRGELISLQNEAIHEYCQKYK